MKDKVALFHDSRHKRNGGIIYQTLNLGTRCQLVVIFTIQQLYALGKEPLAPIEEKSGGS
jgi:hypothetical protein